MKVPVSMRLSPNRKLNVPMTFKEICQFNQQSLSELDSVLKTLNDRQYQHSHSNVSGSVGGHVRHIIDFYYCFFKGTDYALINYDHRQRNTAIESSIELARDYIQNLMSLLNSREIHQKPDSINISAGLNKHTTIEVFSSLSRELVFLQNHTVHHMAIVALLLEQQGLTVPDNFCLATSTCLHRVT